MEIMDIIEHMDKEGVGFKVLIKSLFPKIYVNKGAIITIISIITIIFLQEEKL